MGVSRAIAYTRKCVFNLLANREPVGILCQELTFYLLGLLYTYLWVGVIICMKFT